MMISTRKAVLSQIEAYLARTGMTERQFGIAVHGDPKLVKRLREGAGTTLTVIEKAERLMAGDTPKRSRRAA